MIEPVLKTIDSAPQLKIIEQNSPQIRDADHLIWQKLIAKDFGMGALSKIKVKDDSRWSVLYDVRFALSNTKTVTNAGIDVPRGAGRGEWPYRSVHEDDYAGHWGGKEDDNCHPPQELLRYTRRKRSHERRGLGGPEPLGCEGRSKSQGHCEEVQGRSSPGRPPKSFCGNTSFPFRYWLQHGRCPTHEAPATSPVDHQHIQEKTSERWSAS